MACYNFVNNTVSSPLKRAIEYFIDASSYLTSNYDAA
jgi:hypothetical protein